MIRMLVNQPYSPNDLLSEIIDRIIYFTTNKVSELSLISKYVNQHCKDIRITSDKNYPDIKYKHLCKLPNLIEIVRISNYSEEEIASLTKLIKLDLSSNYRITNKGISGLHNLTSLNLSHISSNITDGGISMLSNLKILNLSYINL